LDASGVMHMQPVEGGLTIPAGGTVELKPGGYHLMLMGLKQKLDEGGQIPLKLTFARAGSVDVQVKIEKKPKHEGMPSGEDHMHSH
jgi:periplasmic copper chaperone A